MIAFVNYGHREPWHQARSPVWWLVIAALAAVLAGAAVLGGSHATAHPVHISKMPGWHT